MARPATSRSGVRSRFPAVEDGASLHEIRRVEAFGEEVIDRAYDLGGIGSFLRFPRQASELGSQLGHARSRLGGDLGSSWYHRSVLIWVFAVENAISLVLGNPGLKRWLPAALSDRLLQVAEPVRGMGSAGLALVMSAGTAVRLYDGERWVDAGAGDFVYLPEWGIHAFRNDSDERASMLILFSPRSARERYFEELAQLARTGQQLTADEWRDLYARHDVFMT